MADTVYVHINKNFVREIERKDGSGTFNLVTLPSGTKIGEIEVGGYTFSPLFVNENKFNPNTVDIPLLADNEVWLQKNIPTEDGDTDKNVVKVPPERLKDALDERYKEYKKEHTIFLNVHENYVAENIERKSEPGTFFNCVTIPKGVTLNGEDLSGWKFYPNHVAQDQYRDVMRGIPLYENRPVELKKMIDGTMEKKEVDATELVEAFKVARKEYLDSKKNEKPPEIEPKDVSAAPDQAKSKEPERDM